MPQSSDVPPENKIPLVVDLDGTLIRTDLLWESIARLLRRNPFSIFQILFWWMRGRAFLKKKLSARIKIDPATLPCNEKFLAWLREQKSGGRKIILATASDLEMALPVANHFGLFDEVLGSDGRQNLRGGNKLKALVAKFGERGFDYAGNSSPDLTVWRGAREAIVVNASRSTLKLAAACAKVGATFPDYSPFANLQSFLNELFWRSGYLVAILAGLLLAAAFPRIQIAGFAWVAPALLVFAARGKNPADTFRIGYLGGITFWLASLYWLLLMPVAGFPILGWVALCAFLALYPAIWLWLVSHQPSTSNQQPSWSGRLLWSLGGAAIWVALEMIRARLLGGFPWSFIGGSQFQMIPLIQIASVTGVYGISFLVVWASLSLYSAVEMIFQKPESRFVWQAEIILPFIVVVGLFTFGEIKLQEQKPAASTLRVTLIQPSIPQTLIWDESQNAIRFRQLLALSQNALTNQPDLLVWPESAVPELDDETYSAITNLFCTHHVWLIFNADDVAPRPNATNEYDNYYFNAAFLLDPNGKIAGVYHKQKLVIFGEYVPFAWLPFVKYLTPITGSYTAGDEPVQFQMDIENRGPDVASRQSSGALAVSLGNRIIASPLICFEDTFPQLARKAVTGDTDFLINLTNDGWFGKSAEQW
ncbi:MAG TPA: apolipoprotein N-acyltransferase, partial [Verrucomicrobiae bacterium]|nr:apolipoprotein N-acyltransferase [Verrucomicrobiae bacterium]